VPAIAERLVTGPGGGGFIAQLEATMATVTAEDRAGDLLLATLLDMGAEQIAAYHLHERAHGATVHREPEWSIRMGLLDGLIVLRWLLQDRVAAVRRAQGAQRT
jgi:hypothetical protein